MLKISSTSFNTRSGRSHHGISHYFKGPRAVTKDLTGIKRVLENCVFTFSWSEYARVLSVRGKHIVGLYLENEKFTDIVI
jgi:hypothetical protein